MKKYPTLFLEQKKHRNASKLIIKFAYDDDLIAIVRKINGAAWSKTLQAWHVPNTKENYAIVLDTFKGITTVNTSKISKIIPFKRDLTKEQKILLNNFYLYL